MKTAALILFALVGCFYSSTVIAQQQRISLQELFVIGSDNSKDADKYLLGSPNFVVANRAGQISVFVQTA